MQKASAPVDVEVLVLHRNAPLSEVGRLRLPGVVDQDVPTAQAAARFRVSRPTAARVGLPLLPVRVGRDERPVLAAAPLSAPRARRSGEW
jgi:hypothetical protein